jgi:hypothetical protein
MVKRTEDRKSKKEKDPTEAAILAHREWTKKEYMKIINLSTLKTYAASRHIMWLSKAINGFQMRFGSIWRFATLAELTYFLPIKKYEYVTTVFSISRQRSLPGTFRKARSQKTMQYHTNYAFLYASQDDKGKFALEYVCTGHTYKSADGEYRHGFIPALQFTKLYDEYYDIIEPYEKHILACAKRGDFSLRSTSHFPDGKSGSARKLQAELDAHRLVIKLFTVTFIIEAFNVYVHYASLHTSAGFKEAMFGVDDIKTFASMYEKQDKDCMRRMMTQFLNVRTSEKSGNMVTMCGQKIIPLRAKELEELENIRYDTWREIYVGQRMGDLVINCISPSFPIFKDYTLLRADPQEAKDFYDNPVNHIKMDHSEVAATVVRELEDVRRKTFVIDPFKKKELYVSYKFEGLSHTIEIPMDYAEKNLIMSNYSVCMLNENVGRTFGDLPNIMQNRVMQIRIGPIFASRLMFSKYVFEYVYGLYCMNYHMGVIHTDLHVNNVTTFDKVKLMNIDTGAVQPPNVNPHIVYGVHDAYYVFPHTGRYGSIIDFSRGIISEEKLHEQFPKRTAKGIVEKEKKRILSKYEMLLPDFYRDNESALKAAVEEKFAVVFKLFSAIDMYIFSQGAAQMIRTQILTDTRLKEYGDRSVIESGILPLLEEMRDIAYETLTGDMFKVFARRADEIRESDFAWPNLRIIQTCFNHALVGAYDPMGQPPIIGTVREIVEPQLIDYYSVDNPLQYNTREYENFPPISKLDYIIEHKLPLFTIGVENWEEHLKYLEREDMEEKSEKIRAEAKEEKKLRRGTDTKPSKKDLERLKTEPGFTSEEIYYDT